MDVREKLVVLLSEKCMETCKQRKGYVCSVEECKRSKEKCCGFYADHLISNGVTVQECGHWVSLTDCANAGVYCSVCHKKVYKEDYAWCNRKNKLRSDYCLHCGAKMMPQPPKGE